jgi:hypothetical protein
MGKVSPSAILKGWTTDSAKIKAEMEPFAPNQTATVLNSHSNDGQNASE